ncbi:IclR family transcriptional regulator [Massilia sp. YIM B04103]|uniref:IclR family transcriptional regulator n=1 Tax=Massilia sp. YIM B04103 TaxID=2963106 RepID=UPI00210AC07F|nr:helix-turn-helix domain-containing protein [Massilia sp. YIM B04103]
MVNENRSIQSVERAMKVLEAMAGAGGEMRLIDLAQKLALHKSTLHGLLNTLAALGYVMRTDNGYALGLRLHKLVLPLANADQQLRTHFAPSLLALAGLTRETCYLAVPGGTRNFLCIDAINGDGTPAMHPGIRRWKLTTSALGQIFLAHDCSLVRALRRSAQISPELERKLQKIAEQGYALDLEESEANLNCLAFPLRKDGRVVAAMAAAGPVERMSLSAMQDFAMCAMQWNL